MARFWSVPYGSAHPTPYWGEQTSAVNFCEEDYVITHLVAEFFNTLTSLLYIGYGIHGIRRFKRNNISAFAPINLPYWGLIGVGIFSGAYHMTLKYHTQMSDELSMHVAIGTVMHQVFTFAQTPSRQRLVRILLLSVLVPFYIYHCVADEFTVHVILFLSMVLTVIWKTRLLIQSRIQNPQHRARLSSLTTMGTLLALTAYVLWNIDVHCCETLTRWKRQVGMPWGVVLELHGWWHGLTAVSTYTFMAVIEFLTYPDAGEKGARGKGFAWPATKVLRELEGPVGNGGAVEGKGVANGKAH